MNKLALQQFSKQYVIQQKRVEEAVDNTFSELPEITSLDRIRINLRLSEVIFRIDKLIEKVFSLQYPQHLVLSSIDFLVEIVECFIETVASYRKKRFNERKQAFLRKVNTMRICSYNYHSRRMQEFVYQLTKLEEKFLQFCDYIYTFVADQNLPPQKTPSINNTAKCSV